jgi:hypothetical protein
VITYIYVGVCLVGLYSNVISALDCT